MNINGLSEVAQMAADTLDRLLAEAGGAHEKETAFDPRLWASVREVGIADALKAVCQEDKSDESGLGIEGALNLFAVAAKHAAPVPFAEHGFSMWAAAQCGFDIETDLMVPAGLGVRDTVEIAADGRVSGVAYRVPFARHADTVIVFSDSRAALCRTKNLLLTHDENAAGEARDRVEFKVSAEVRPLRVDLSTMRASMAGIRAIQIAGALGSVLELTANYVQEREQFGRPIARFQTVQQALAELGGQVATAQAASRLVSAAFGQGDAVGLLAAAKIRTSEAVGLASRIAHQAHGAIGFTQEYALQRFTRRLWGWRDDNGSDAWWARWLGVALAEEGADALWPVLTAGLRFNAKQVAA